MAKQLAQPNTKTLETILQWGIYAVALVPLIIFKDFLSPFHFGKVIVFRPYVEILAILYVALVFKDRRFLPPLTYLFWTITAFVGVYGLASLTSINIYQSIMGTHERMGGWFTLFHFWMFFVIATGVLKSKEAWLTFAKVSVVAGLLSTLYGFLQKTDVSWVVGSGGRTRIFGTIGNPALFAGYVIINTFFAFALAMRARTGIRWFYWSVFALNLIAVFMSAVRGSVLGTVLALALFAAVYLWRGSSRTVKSTFTPLVIAAILFELLIIVNKDSSFVQNNSYFRRLADISLKTRLIQTRFWAWQAGIDGWNDSAKTVLVGWGPENFNIPFSKHFNPEFFQGPGSETLYDRAHNMFVEILVTMGLIGFVSYIAIFVILFGYLYAVFTRAPDANDRAAGLVLASGLIAYIIHNCFIFDTSANYIVFFIAAGLVQALYLNSATRSSAAPAAPRRTIHHLLPATLVYSMLIILSIVMIYLTYTTSIVPAKANYATTRAIVASWAGDHKAAVEKFIQAVSYDTFGSYEIRHRFAQYVLENFNKFKPENGFDLTKIMSTMMGAVSKNLYSKQDYLPYLYLSRAYIMLGKGDPNSKYNDLALQNSQKALEISPTFVRTYYEVAQAYINKKDYKNAVVMFQKAAELNPEVGLTWWYLGATQLEGKMVEDGLASIKTARERGYDFTANENDLLRVINAYAALGDFTEVAGLYEKLIIMKPNNPQYHASLATAYAQVRRIDDAVREAKKAAELDPSFKDEAQRFVASLGRTW